jgi:hypothetical protein
LPCVSDSSCLSLRQLACSHDTITNLGSSASPHGVRGVACLDLLMFGSMHTHNWQHALRTHRETMPLSSVGRRRLALAWVPPQLPSAHAERQSGLDRLRAMQAMMRKISCATSTPTPAVPPSARPRRTPMGTRRPSAWSAVALASPAAPGRRWAPACTARAARAPASVWRRSTASRRCARPAAWRVAPAAAKVRTHARGPVTVRSSVCVCAVRVLTTLTKTKAAARTRSVLDWTHARVRSVLLFD